MSASPWCLLGRAAQGPDALLIDLDAGGAERAREQVAPGDLARAVAAREAAAPTRWVWSDTPAWYDALLAAGVRVERCHDLRLVHVILARSARIADPCPLQAADSWDRPPDAPAPGPAEQPGSTLFDLETAAAGSSPVPQDAQSALEELRRQLEAIAGADEPTALRLLAAAESAGALVAAEMRAAGMPWDAQEHDRILVESLGARPRAGALPARMEALAQQVREALGDPHLSLDSPPRLLRALHRAEIPVDSTSKWELSAHEHPAIAPLLRYKEMSRLLTANGWAWLDAWVREGRYRPVYVPGGVVTGRWASSGGGALQIPRRLRPALRADPGWLLVSADVSQLEPRVLAAMSQDPAMAAAGAGRDLYAGIVESGIVATRQEAKVGMLGALYGGTSGDSGVLVRRLRVSFPAAMGLVDDAAAVGERGGTVSTWLGRSSPPPDPRWLEAQREANLPEASAAAQERARRSARDRGRFTRNFVVQGTAAEWALSWIAALRLSLARLPDAGADDAAEPSGPVFSRRAHLVHFLHDEVLVHSPAAQAEDAAAAIRDAAESAGRLLFPGSAVDFPLELAIAERSEAK